MDENLHSWNQLVLRLAHIHLRERPDIFRWSLKHDGKFSISSMYQELLDSDIVHIIAIFGRLRYH
jgi:hypothetical protein